jgi:penicillin G amidase
VGDFVDQLREQAAAASFPQDGELRVHGTEGPVQIHRDRWGVPSIEAGSLDDLWFAQGLVTAGERLFQLDMLLRTANGRLSEVFSERALAEDRFARTIGFHQAGARMALGWDEESHRMIERFRAGVFAWIDAMPAAPVEYGLLDFAPELPADYASWGAAFSYLAWSLSGNWDRELLRRWVGERAGAEAVRALFPPLARDDRGLPPGGLHGKLSDAVADSLLDSMPRERGMGSNAWAIAGSRSATGKPFLANDPHLLALQPGVWLECHLSAPGYRARGVALIFSPGVLLGTTAHHAWGATNVSGDVQDLYVERLNDEGTAAEYDGAWEPLAEREETILVRGSDPESLRVRSTRHGPLIGSFVSGHLGPEYVDLGEDEHYALAWTGHEHGVSPSVALHAAAAGDFEAFREAVGGLACPGQNLIYADVEGTIGYTCTGAFPMRRAGDGTAPVPGWTSQYGWEGTIPGDELPWSKDPERGFLASANNRMHSEDYPYLIGMDFHASYRARRIADVLAAGTGLTLEDMTTLQNDALSLPALEVLPLLTRLEPETPDQAEALEQLRAWDARMDSGSRAAALYNAWARAIAQRTLEPILGADLFRHYHAEPEVFRCSVLASLLDPEQQSAWPPHRPDDDLLRDALDDALAYLRTFEGSQAPTWGEIHRLRLAHPLAAIPGLSSLFEAADIPFGGDEQTVMAGGFDGRAGFDAAVIPAWRAVFDLDDLDRSVGVLPSGISGNPASPHWNDQTPLYAEGLYREMPFTERAVEATTVATLRVVSYHP